MFSMEEIGRKILSLRKSRNMTQVNLADKLGITYQAVSSWERGNSMPDIEKLPEIAKLFEISIDELIEESKVVTMILNTSEQEPENFEKLTEEDITEVLPILKPDQITEVVNGVNKSALKDINKFLPFMEPEDVKKYICEYYHIPTEPALQNNAALETTVRTIVQNEQNNNAAAIAGKIEKMNCLWQENRDEIDRTLRSIFECTLESQQLRALMSVNCVCPYDFENKRIYINHRKSLEEMLETCVHELIHYYWFHKWNALFKDQYSSSLVWIFSEIAIDALFFETPLKKYCVSQHPAHDHFYEESYKGQNLMEYFRKSYRDHSMADFMRLGIEDVTNLNTA